MNRLVVVLASALVVAGCATASGPPASAVAVDTTPSGANALRGARTVWLEAAVSRTGGLAAGLDAGAQSSGADRADVRDDLAVAVRRVRGLELAAAREGADLVLYFERADRLRCFGCRQPDDLWHWWGVVADGQGRELASLHGETAGGSDDAARQFVKSVKKLARSRHGGRGNER